MMGGVEAKGKKYPMCGLTDWMFRLRALLRRVVVEKELDEELRFHLEREAEKLMGSGRTRPEALRLAKLALGGVDQIKEECRQARGVVLLEPLSRISFMRCVACDTMSPSHLLPC
jgi:hypothetical protein